jgi:hypothetical protein
MKTFNEFQEQLSLSQAFQKVGKGPGVGDWESSRTLNSLRGASTSDRAKPKGSKAGIPTVSLNQATYRGRAEAGRNPKYQDNPDYTGPTIGFGGSPGTKDRMPGTTPSNNPRLSTTKLKSKPLSTSKPKSNYSNFI